MKVIRFEYKVKNENKLVTGHLYDENLVKTRTGKEYLCTECLREKNKKIPLKYEKNNIFCPECNYNFQIFSKKLELEMKEKEKKYKEWLKVKDSIEKSANEFNTFLKSLKNSYIDFETKSHLKKTFNENYEVIEKNDLFISKESDELNCFYRFFRNFEENIKKLNEKYIEKELENNNDYLDSLYPHSLSEEQKRIIVSDEFNTQIIAGAGTGKTTTLLAKVKYLIEKKNIPPKSISCHSFSKKSTNDIKKKWKKLNEDSKDYSWKNVNIRTIHSLGLSILKEHDRYTELVDKEDSIEKKLRKIIEVYLKNDILKDSVKSKDLIKYFSIYMNMNEKYHQNPSLNDLIDIQNNIDFQTFKSYLVLDNKVEEKNEYVNSIEELWISNYLFLNGIEYEYNVNLSLNSKIKSNCSKSVYKKNLNKKKLIIDFYLPKYDLYLQHFGVNGKGEVPWFSNIDKKKFLKEKRWKECNLKNNNLNYVKTYSLYRNENFLKKLKESLLEKNVEFDEINYTELYNEVINNRKFKYKFKLFINLIETFINLFKGNGFKKDTFEEFYKKNEELPENLKIRNRIILDVAKAVYTKYENYLNKESLIDFNDMVNNATGLVKEYGTKNKFQYIIVDEYQDVSFTRNKLLKALQDTCKSKFIVFGDDWQSIYRFTGTNLSLFVNFEEYFHGAEVMMLKNTRRNSQELTSISGNFIKKNPFQIKKGLKSRKRNQKPLKVYEFTNSIERITQTKIFKKIIDDIIEKFPKESIEEKGILVIGRNNNDRYNVIDNKFFTYDKGKIIYKMNKKVKIDFSTVHGSKGLEYKNIVIINLFNAIDGFPNLINDDPILDFVIKNDENFPHSEERRLFYVSLTRTENNVYMMVPILSESIFSREIKKDYSQNIEVVNNIKQKKEICKKCGGLMTLRGTGKNQFLGCSNYPTCTFKIPISLMDKLILCPKCKEGFLQDSKFKGVYCTNYPECKNEYESSLSKIIECCPRCDNGVLIKEKNLIKCTSKKCDYIEKK